MRRAVAITKRTEIQAPNGSSARLEGTAIVVRNDAGDIVAAYDEATRTTRIVAPDGDLVLAAPKGKVIVESGVGIEVRTPRWEVHAERIIENAVDVFRDVKGLAQTRAHRMRSVVRDAYRLLAGRTSIVSEEDTAIDGKRVLLG